MLNEELMTPYERLKAAYKMYDAEQKKHIKKLREIIDCQAAEIEKLKEEIENLRNLQDETWRLAYIEKLETENKGMKKGMAKLSTKVQACHYPELMDDEKAALVIKCGQLKDQLEKAQADIVNKRESINELICSLNGLRKQLEAEKQNKE